MLTNVCYTLLGFRFVRWDKNNIMKEVIEKYEAKLEFLNTSLDKTKHLMDEDTLEMMQDVKTLLEEVVSDFRALANEA